MQDLAAFAGMREIAVKKTIERHDDASFHVKCNRNKVGNEHAHGILTLDPARTGCAT
jgi:hypothetical protein